MKISEIIQQYGQFESSNAAIAFSLILSGIIATLLIIGAVGSKDVRRIAYFSCLGPLLTILACALIYSLGTLEKNRNDAVKLIDSVLAKESNIAEAKLVEGKIYLRIQTKEKILLGITVKEKDPLVVLTLTGAERLNEIYLQKHGIAMLPPQK